MSNHIIECLSAAALAQHSFAQRPATAGAGRAAVFGHKGCGPTKRSSRPPGTHSVQTDRCRPASA
jgi:hypothetical protein